tara:strand:+ start:526 stop:735 length:210 start_codon:yes stop_codon:yes gene_type:complete
MRELLNELAEYVNLPRLLIVVFLVVVPPLIAEIAFDFELKKWYRLIYICVAYGFWDSTYDLIIKPKNKK